ncbi:MAG: chromosome segregation protein SMC, partial [Lachnospiraceae bacterium]|nr:chromosome segregation protein SMC [Lachnospiraceae bacterium]
GKEGYSIIGQGQIDKILSGRPEDRRELFDEAAGIVKFKRRKTIAQKKLEDEKQNLVRVSDILTELEKQVGPLEKQAETAKEYLRLRDELKRYDVSLFLAENTMAEEQLSELSKKEQTVSDDMEASKRASEELKNDYERIEQELMHLDEEISSLQASENEALMQAGSLDGRIHVLNEQIRTEEMNAEHIRSRIKAIESELLDRSESRRQYETEKDGLFGRVHEMKGRLIQAENENERAAGRIEELERLVETKKAALIEALNEKSGLSGKKQRYDTLLEQARVRRLEVANRLLKVKSDEEGWENQIREQEAAVQGIAAEIAELLANADALKEDASRAGSEITRLNRNLNHTQQEYHTAYTKLESLRNLAERYEGYGNSIRRVMEVRDRVHGIHGVVADLIEVPKQYEIAIETALGGSIQNIVTDSEETAKILIEHLKKNKYGRATFLPLTGISGRGGIPDGDVLTERGVIGVAGTLVGCKPEYRELVQYLLGRVLVVDHIDHAIAIARKYRHSLRIVTPDGELLNPGGSLSGGAFKNSSNLLGRRREMEELEEACKKALIHVDRIQGELVLQEALLAQKSEELEQTNRLLQEKYLEENTAKVNLDGLYEKKDEVTESFADMNLENKELEKQIWEIQESAGAIEREMDALEAENKQRNEQLESDGKELEKARTEKETTAAALAKLQLEAAEVRQQDDFLSQNLARIAKEESRLKTERESLEGGTVLSQEAVESRLAEIERLKEQIKTAEATARDYKEKTLAAREQKEQKNAGQRRFIEKRDELGERIADLDKELFRLQNQREKLEEKRDSSVEYMWSEYGLTFTTARELLDETLTSMSDMRRQIADRKGKIKGLGNVNVNAIEDYKEISGRYEFMKTQHDDLITAQDALFRIIEELDAGMRAQFTEKFAKIRQEFDRVFKELFGGGHGTLELVEDEDILEAGIQIISQPPGKKLQNMMQMSGGEKALTAIALLFAIQNLKPSPFCLLDEIEAALDDSNVDRFAKYLHKLTRHTQFIVITHRRGTMVAADRLYGITMQEKGVSTLVSVNLIEDGLE